MTVYIVPVGTVDTGVGLGHGEAQEFGPVGIPEGVPWERVGDDDDQPDADHWLVRVPPAAYRGPDTFNPLDFPTA